MAYHGLDGRAHAGEHLVAPGRLAAVRKDPRRGLARFRAQGNDLRRGRGDRRRFVGCRCSEKWAFSDESHSSRVFGTLLVKRRAHETARGDVADTRARPRSVREIDVPQNPRENHTILGKIGEPFSRSVGFGLSFTILSGTAGSISMHITEVGSCVRQARDRDYADYSDHTPFSSRPNSSATSVFSDFNGSSGRSVTRMPVR